MSLHRQKFSSLLVGLAGVVGFVAMLALSAHHPAFATLLRVAAFAWLLVCGFARLALDLADDDRASAEDDRLGAARDDRAGRAFDFTRGYR
jgi:hypothetical protein